MDKASEQEDSPITVDIRFAGANMAPFYELTTLPELDKYEYLLTDTPQEWCECSNNQRDSSTIGLSSTSRIDMEDLYSMPSATFPFMPQKVFPVHHGCNPNTGTTWPNTDCNVVHGEFQGENLCQTVSLSHLDLSPQSWSPEADSLSPNNMLGSSYIPQSYAPYVPETLIQPSALDIYHNYYGEESFPVTYKSPPPHLAECQEQSLPDEQEHSPLFSPDSLTGPPLKSPKHVENTNDKPYAVLIFEALSGAPRKSMTLRGIYDWFEKNTTKPQESGTNGWQNSIRHNLSMNQAFENDKSVPCQKGHSRKANSVWKLTAEALKSGVQSTTRYRKAMATQKGSNIRTSTAQRHRSGARGGRTARKSTARQRKKDESLKCTGRNVPSNTEWTLQRADMVLDQGQGGHITQNDQLPPTPTELLPFYQLPDTSYALDPAQHIGNQDYELFEDVLPINNFLVPRKYSAGA